MGKVSFAAHRYVKTRGSRHTMLQKHMGKVTFAAHRYVKTRGFRHTMLQKYVKTRGKMQISRWILLPFFSLLATPKIVIMFMM